MKNIKKTIPLVFFATALIAAPSIYSLAEPELSADAPKYRIYVTLDDQSLEEAEFISSVIPAAFACYFRSVGDQSIQNQFLSDGAAYIKSFDQYKCEDDSGILSALPKNPNIASEIIAKASRKSADDPIIYKIWMSLSATDNEDKIDSYYASVYENKDYAVMKLFPNASGQYGKLQIKGANDSFNVNLLGNEASVIFDDTVNGRDVTDTIFLRALVDDGVLSDGSARYYVGRSKNIDKLNGVVNKDAAFVTDKETNTIIRSDDGIGGSVRCYKLGRNLQTLFDRSVPHGYLMYQAGSGSRIKNVTSYSGFQIKSLGSSVASVPNQGGLIFNNSLDEGLTYQLTNGQISEDIKVKAYRRNVNLPQVANPENDSLCAPLIAKLASNFETMIPVKPPESNWTDIIEFPSNQNIPQNPKRLLNKG